MIAWHRQGRLHRIDDQDLDLEDHELYVDLDFPLDPNSAETSSSSEETMNQDAEDVGSQHGENPNPAAKQEPMTLRHVLIPERNVTPSCIVFPIGGGTFHFRNGMIQLLPTFHGMESEQPYLHMREFEEVCATFSDQNCPEDLVRLKLFPFSLKDKAKTWLLSLRPQSVNNWRQMQELFLKKFFPIYLNNNFKRQIMTFAQKENETFYQVWER